MAGVDSTEATEAELSLADSGLNGLDGFDGFTEDADMEETFDTDVEALEHIARYVPEVFPCCICTLSHEDCRVLSTWCLHKSGLKPVCLVQGLRTRTKD